MKSEERIEDRINLDKNDILMILDESIIFRNNRAMIDFAIHTLGIEVPGSLKNIMKSLDRQWFVYNLLAYTDVAIPIGLDTKIRETLSEEAQIQTCSQPSTVIRINHYLDLKPGMEGLEIGTGCSYHAHATAAQIFPGTLYTIERIKNLYELSCQKHEEIKVLENEYPQYRSIFNSEIEFIYTDGSRGYPKKAPYDFIYFTAGFKKPLKEREEKVFLKQLKEKGKFLYPLERGPLYLIEKDGKKIEKKRTKGMFKFVPVKKGIK